MSSSRRCRRPTPTPTPSAGSVPSAQRAWTGCCFLDTGTWSRCWESTSTIPMSIVGTERLAGTAGSTRRSNRHQQRSRARASPRPPWRAAQRVPLASCMNGFLHPTGPAGVGSRPTMPATAPLACTHSNCRHVSSARRRRVDASPVEDQPRGTRRERVAKSGQVTVDAPVAQVGCSAAVRRIRRRSCSGSTAGPAGGRQGPWWALRLTSDIPGGLPWWTAGSGGRCPAGRAPGFSSRWRWSP
jgi:hypothetical protein